MSAHAEQHHHGPPLANQSSRINASVLGMFLFIASEAMLFGAFFTAYFFVRVVNPEAQAWPLEPFHLPVFVAGVNTAVLLTSSSSYAVSELPADKNSKLVFYCANTMCSAGQQAAKRAMENGYTNVAVLPEGIAGWKQAGQPTAKPRS